MSDFDLLPDQPGTLEHVRRFGPAAVIALVSLLFIFQNTERTRFSFLWFEFDWPLWIMLVVFMAAGAVVAYGITRRVKSRKQRKAKRVAAAAEFSDD